MSTQTSTVVNLMAARHAKLRQPNMVDEYAKLSKLHGITLNTGRFHSQTPVQKTHSWLTTLFVVLAHMAAIYLFITQTPIEKIIVTPAKPMMVNLIAPPAPEPELVPVIEPIKQQFFSA